MHHIFRRVSLGPKLKLLRSLGHKHRQAVQDVTSGFACLAQEPGFDWIVNQIVHQPRTAELRRTRRRFILKLSDGPPRIFS
jgi:hypothetical protein